ncbi:MAG: hypothetical protein Q9174_007158, partial [Haloplaca sp. 1 TL-2023]
KDGVTCDFESLHPAAKSRSSQSQSTEPQPSNDNSTAPQTSDGPTEEYTPDTITRTRLMNPIVFNYEASAVPSSARPECHFCTDILYPLLGIDADTKPQHSQAPGGKMCTSCTLDRIQVMACSEHSVIPLPGMDSATFNQQRVTDFLTSDDDEARKEYDWEWCSLCPEAAFWGCGGAGTFPPPKDLADVKRRYFRPQPPSLPANGADAAVSDVIDFAPGAVTNTRPNDETLNTEDIQAKLDEGCGARFCDLCAEMLIESVGNLDCLIERKAGLVGLGDDEFLVRADVGLLYGMGMCTKAMARDGGGS